MDRVGLATLQSEVHQDLAVMNDALTAARDRLHQPPPAGLEACAPQLCRLYNAFAQMGLRISKAFENHIAPTCPNRRYLPTRFPRHLYRYHQARIGIAPPDHSDAERTDIQGSDPRNPERQNRPAR